METVCRDVGRRIGWLVVQVSLFGSLYGLVFIWFSLRFTTDQERAVAATAVAVAVGLVSLGTIVHRLGFAPAHQQLLLVSAGVGSHPESDSEALEMVLGYPQRLAVRLAILAEGLLTLALAASHQWITPFNSQQVVSVLVTGGFVTVTFAVICYFRCRWLLGPAVAALVERGNAAPRRDSAGITIHLWLFSLAVAIVPLVFLGLVFTNQSLRAIEKQLLRLRTERMRALAMNLQKEGMRSADEFEELIRAYVGEGGSILITTQEGDVIYPASAGHPAMAELFIDPITKKPRDRGSKGAFNLRNSNLPQALVEDLLIGGKSALDDDSPTGGKTATDVLGGRMIVTQRFDIPHGKSADSARLWCVFRREGGELATAVRLVMGLGILVVVLVGTMIAIFGQMLRGPLRQIEVASERIARGDLTQHVRVMSVDEIGLVALGFRRMHENLLRLLGRVTDSAQKVGDVATELIEASQGIQQSSRTQVHSVEDTSGSIAQMSTSITGILESIEELKTSAGETSTSIEGMNRSIRTVDSHMEMLSRSVESTATSISQMATSIRQIAASSAHLSDDSETTATAMQAIDLSLRQIRERADQTLALAERVIHDASEARVTVERATGSIDHIVETSNASRAAMSVLQRNLEDVGEVLRIQKSMSGSTKLLALNATIIAARSGEEGHEFGVVANDIKELSIQSREKTKDIERLIEQIRAAGRTAQEADTAGRASIEEGERRSRETGESLHKILESAALSTESVKGIAISTQEQARQSQQVRRAIQKVAAGVSEISRATDEQRKGSDLIQRATDEIRDYSQLVRRTAQDQRTGIENVVRHIATIRDMVDAIRRATGDLDRGSERVVESIDTIRGATRRTDTMIEHMNARVRALFDEAESLTGEVSRFRLSNETSPSGSVVTSVARHSASGDEPRLEEGGPESNADG